MAKKKTATGVAVQTRLAPNVKRRLEERARAEGISLADYVRRLLLRDAESAS